jgi:arsenical pump membrane protein
VSRAANEGTQALSAASTASGALAGPPAEALSCLLLAAVLITAITRPKRLPEAVVAVPAAAAVIPTGALPVQQARVEAGRLLPVLAFLGRSWWSRMSASWTGCSGRLGPGWPGPAAAHRARRVVLATVALWVVLHV